MGAIDLDFIHIDMIVQYKDSEYRKERLRKYLRKNPEATCREIKRDTSLKVERLYDSLKEAYDDAGVKIPKRLKKRNKRQQMISVIDYIIANPDSRVSEIQKETGVSIPRVFGTIEDAFRIAGVPYQKAPPQYGVMCTDIISRAQQFENMVCDLLKHFGSVQRQVWCGAGRVDAILKTDSETWVIEVKDFRARNNITKSQVKQLFRYLDSLGCSNGLIVCPKESLPKRGKKVIFKNGAKIQITTPSRLGAIV